MMYVLEITEAAAEDAEMIRKWYEEQQKDLGNKFIDALQTAGQKLLANPQAFSIWKKNIRRIILSPFAYKVYYRIDGEKVIIFLIAHERRSNQFLKRRIKNQEFNP